jgi:K+-sensing histidine kinase KdpD
MIGHEIRTPANGILGIGELILDLCPDTPERELYADLFQKSGRRLRDLIEDAALIVDLDQRTMRYSATTSFPELLDRVRASIPAMKIGLVPPSGLESVLLKGDALLLEKALRTLLLLAASFSQDKNSVLVTGMDEDGCLSLRLVVDALHLASEQAAGFFELESLARSASSAEPLGLAPAVAYKIISALGGTTSLVKGMGNSGHIDIMLPKETSHV